MSSERLIRVYTYMTSTGQLYHITSPGYRRDYDIHRALKARADGDDSYFFNELPPATVSGGIVTAAPPPPSQRGWTSYEYPDIPSELVGQAAKDVLVPPTFPLTTVWHDPNPPTNNPAAYVGLAPDGSVSIEVRIAHPTQYVTAYFPMLKVPTEGRRWAGVSFDVWHEEGYVIGPDLGASNKVGGGLFAGGTPSTGGAGPSSQKGVTVRNTWVLRSTGSTNEIYVYNLNRLDEFGLKNNPSAPNQWTTGRWQRLEYEGFINHPGRANGFARMWIDGVCIGEVTNAIFALNDEWFWQGPAFSDTWELSSLSSAQKRWIKNIRAYHP